MPELEHIHGSTKPKPKPKSKPSKPSKPSDYFGSMYTSPPPAQTGQSGGVAGSGLVPVTVDAGFGLDNNIVMVPVDKAPPSAGGTGGTGITGIGTGDFEDDPIASSGDDPYIPPKKDDEETIIDKSKDAAEKLLTSLMGGGVGGDPTVVKGAYQQPGKHKLRAQYDYLLAKYGPAWATTTQAKELANYLSGVPVERGGGLGARDDTYGGLTSWDQLDPDMEAKRQELLDQISKTGTHFGSGTDIATQLQNITQDEYGADLTEDQWFNFRQQLMAADPTPGNQAYKEAFPWSSGAGIEALATPTISFAKDILGIESVAPAEYQGTGGQTFYDTSVPVYGGGGGSGAGIPSLAAPSDPINVTFPSVPPETTPDLTPDLTPIAGIPTPFNYSQWPQFGPAGGPIPNYVNQGLGSAPQFNYWNQIANTFPGMR